MAVAISHTASFEYAAVDTDHDEAGVAIGTAAADRLVFAIASAVLTATGSDINTMSIGGVSASRARRDEFEYVGVGAFNGLEVWWALVPTGTDATISFAHDADYSSAKFSVYAVTGANTATPVADSDYATRSDDLANALSVTVDVPENGGAIGAAVGGIYITSVTAAWTYLSEDLDNDHESGFFIGFSTASAVTAGASAGQAVTATLTGTGDAFNDGRALVVITLAAGVATTDAETTASGTGAATGAAAAIAATVFSAAGSGTVTAVGSVGGEVDAAASIGGSGTAAAMATSIAGAAASANGSGAAAAVPESSGLPLPDYAPVGGGGGFGPAPRHAKQPFRTRKDKSHPKVITVRIGDWPEDPQIILAREEESERAAFYRQLSQRKDPEIISAVDEEEQFLMAILAAAA